MKKRTYFMDVQLTTGEWVTVLYESASRKGTFPHQQDFWMAYIGNIKISEESKKYTDAATFAYILNEKNKDEQCFGEHRVIDLRQS